MAETTRVDRAEVARQVEKAEKLLQKGKSADALDVYLQVLEMDPLNDTVYVFHCKGLLTLPGCWVNCLNGSFNLKMPLAPA